ncbi:hypothetical protein D3C73_1352820 [compost metagenome]
MASAIRLYQRLGFKRAYETDLMNGDTLVQGFRLDLIPADGQDADHPLTAQIG